MDKAQIHERLERAEQDVKKSEQLIEQQQERLKELASDGHPAEIHEEKLKLFEKRIKPRRRFGMDDRITSLMDRRTRGLLQS